MDSTHWTRSQLRLSRDATREGEIDQMLRAGLFVDLHTVLKRSIRASVEEYSLKALEVFHGFQRMVLLENARKAMRAMEHGLELGAIGLVNEPTRAVVMGYNADDCLSTLSLRNWLRASAKGSWRTNNWSSHGLYRR